MDIVYYHGGCPDGWAAAVVANLKYPEAEFIPLTYGNADIAQLREEVKGKDVLMIDFAPKTIEEGNELFGFAKSFRILDHHKTAIETFAVSPYFYYDNDRSGAGLAWDYLFGIDAGLYEDVVIPRPWWVSYTEDQDLWRFKLPHSRAVNQWLNIQDRKFDHWQQTVLTQESPAHVIGLGYAIQGYIDYMVASALKDVQEGSFMFHGRKYRTAVVNNGHIGTSEIGEALYQQGYEIAMMWREDGKGMMRFGLRSDKVDVGEIAKSFPGGGGHKAASGFELNLFNGRLMLDEILGRGSFGRGGMCGPLNRCC